MPTTFANTIDGNEILAKRSQCDYAGADIQTTYATKSEVTTGLASKQDTISDLATIRSGAADGATAVQPGDLAAVATTGAYSDLTGTPTIPSGTQLVPVATSADADKVLTVDSQGTPAWSTPAAGGGDAVLTYNVSTWSDFTTAYNAGKNIRVAETVNGTTYEAVLFEYNPNGSPHGYAKFTATTLRTGVGAVGSHWYQISNIGSGVWSRGAGTIQGNFSGQGAISVNSSSHIISLTLDGSSLTQSNSGLAVANPLPSTLGTAGQVLTVNAGATGVEWATPSGGGSVTDVEVNGTSVVNASGVAEVAVPSGTQLVPAATSADADKVLTVDGQGIPGWAVVPSGSTGLFEAVYGQTSYSDITQAISDKKIVYCRISATGASRMAFLAYIGTSNVEFQYYRSMSLHSVTHMTDEVYVYTVSSSGWTTTTRNTGVEVTAGTHMSQRYSNGTLTLNAEWPDVDRTYKASSTKAQSGTAVAEAIATKEDAFDVGTGLEMDTSGSTPTLQVEAPVDIVAGPGIAIDNPDGNTLRVSVAQAEEVVLYENNNPSQIISDTSLTLSESYLHFEKVKLYLRASGGNTTQGSYIVESTIYQSENTEVSALPVVNAIGSVMYDMNVFLFNTTAPTTCYAKSNGTRLNIASSGISTTANRGTRVYKIIGVHRIAGGN